MHSNEATFVELARRIGMIGLQASHAYQQAQDELELERVLSIERLSSPAGTRASIETLERLSALTAAHRDGFARFMVGAVEQLNAALGEGPQAQSREFREGMVQSINWNLDAQGSFYVRREEWIAAARAICELVDSRRASIGFSGEGMAFDEDADLECFNRLVATADHIHRLESSQLAERLARLQKSLAVLGIHGP